MGAKTGAIYVIQIYCLLKEHIYVVLNICKGYPGEHVQILP